MVITFQTRQAHRSRELQVPPVPDRHIEGRGRQNCDSLAHYGKLTLGQRAKLLTKAYFEFPLMYIQTGTFPRWPSLN